MTEMTAIIIIIVGYGLYYFLHEKLSMPRHRRKKPILSVGKEKWDIVIFLSGYVVAGIIIFWFELDYQSLPVLVVAIPLNLVWWYLCLEGRKEMIEKRLREEGNWDYLKKRRKS